MTNDKSHVILLTAIIIGGFWEMAAQPSNDHPIRPTTPSDDLKNRKKFRLI
jgi:hypothetical protein